LRSRNALEARLSSGSLGTWRSAAALRAGRALRARRTWNARGSC